MERTTETTARMVLVRYDADGKEMDRFHLHNTGSAHFADVANTLDHARQTGLQPFTEEAKKDVKPLVKAK